MVMKIIIKMADINTPTKSFDLHRSWTERITEEFYQQSEEEMVLGLSPTIFMDRNHPEKLPAIQLSFIQHLVSPLFQGAAAAGIIPGILETTAKIDGKETTVIVVMSLSVCNSSWDCPILVLKYAFCSSLIALTIAYLNDCFRAK